VKVATHSGSFHADDVFAVAALGLAVGPLELVRTREPTAWAACDIRVDVGSRHDPSTGDFDHHQPAGAGARANGIRLASFGLVWRHFGEGVCGDGQVAAQIDAKLVQVIDANDNGQTVVESLVEGLAPLSLGSVIAAFNPVWDAPQGPEDYLRLFTEAVQLATQILRREIEMTAAQERAAHLVAQAVSQASDPRLILLDAGLPWRAHVVTQAPEALYVVYPKDSGWGLQAVPRELDSFANRRDLPQEWAGREGAELARITGVADALFCHNARFMAAAATRDGILALADLALAGAPGQGLASGPDRPRAPEGDQRQA